MEEEELISKKELLLLTGISYGQLYRWKRENLIPEAWFIKKPSFTGQETFFPKEKIQKRIKEITELKDQFSLEELAGMISPELTKRAFDSADLKQFPELNAEILSQFEVTLKKSYFSYIELVFLLILTKIKEELNLNTQSVQEIIESASAWSKSMKDTSYRFLVLLKKKEKLFVLIRNDARFFTDSQTEVLKTVDLEESGKDLGRILKQLMK